MTIVDQIQQPAPERLEGSRGSGLPFVRDLARHGEAPALRALVALAPLPPIAAALRAIVRYIRDADEMQQRIELEAVCVATALVSLLYMAGGFLQAAKVIDVPAAAAMIWMFPLVCFTYGLAKVVVARRYR